MAKDKHPGGRPLKFKTAEELQKAIDKYFDTETFPTLSGLAYHIGMSRASLYNYADKDQFLDTLKSARRKIESIYENLLLYGKSQTGVIFALKNTGWSDKQEHELSGSVNLHFDKEDSKL